MAVRISSPDRQASCCQILLRCLVFALVSLSLNCLVWPANQQIDVARSGVIDRAAKLRGDGRIEDAIKVLSEAISADPKCVACYLLRSNIFASKGRFTEAASDAKKLMALEPTVASHRARLGCYLAEAGHFDEGLRLCNEATRLAPTCLEVFYLRATVYQLRPGKLQAAIADARKALDPANPHCGFFLASLLRRAGDRRQAVLELNRVLKREPKFEPALFMRAQIEWETQKVDAAMQDWKQCCSIAPQDPNAFLAYGTCLEFRKRYDEAVKAYGKVIEIDPACSNALQCRSGIYRMQGNNFQALTDLKRVMKLAQGDPEQLAKVTQLSVTNYCELLIGLHRLQEGLEFCNCWLGKSGLASNMQRLLREERGQFNFLLGNYSNAFVDFQNATKGGKVSMGDRLDAEFVRTANQLDGRAAALSLCNHFLKFNPKSPWLLKASYDLQQGSGNLNEALATVDQLILLKPDMCELHEEKAELLVKTRSFDKALAEYDLLIGLNPKRARRYEVSKLKLYESMARYDQAIGEYTKLIEGAPPNAELLYSRADLYDKVGDKEKANRDRKAAEALLSKF